VSREVASPRRDQGRQRWRVKVLADNDSPLKRP
jgi:hypothetical protein